MRHRLRACKLSIRPEILGLSLDMLKYKTRRVSYFSGYIYTTSNFISLFSPLAISQNSTQDFFHYFMWKKRIFPPKKEKNDKLVFWTITMFLRQTSHIIMYWNRKVYSLQDSMHRKLPIISKNTSNKSCWILNFLRKTQWMHVSICPRSGGRGPKDYHVSNVIMYWNGKVCSL